MPFIDKQEERLKELCDADREPAVLAVDFYEKRILRALDGHYDDADDYMNILVALSNIQKVVLENLSQAIKL